MATNVNERWTFEYVHAPPNTEDDDPTKVHDWSRSGVTHKERRAAADSAAEWLDVCSENGYTVAVRLVKVRE